MRVTYSDGFDGLPVPSPDGKQLAWTSSRSGGGRAAVPRAVESREGARGASRTRRRESSASQRAMTKRFTLAAARRVAARCWRRLVRRSTRRRTAHTRARRGARRRDAARRPADRIAGRTLAGDYIVAQLKRIGAKPLPGQRDYRLPFEFTAGTQRRRIAARSRRPLTNGVAGGRLGQYVHQRPRTCRRCRSPTTATVTGAGGLRRLRHRRAREPGLRLRQLRGARREGQGRPRAALLPRGRRSEDQGDPRALLRPALQGDGGAAARREGACSSSPGRARRTPARRFR